MNGNPACVSSAKPGLPQMIMQSRQIRDKIEKVYEQNPFIGSQFGTDRFENNRQF